MLAAALLIIGFLSFWLWIWERVFSLDAYDNAMKRARRLEAKRQDALKPGY